MPPKPEKQKPHHWTAPEHSRDAAWMLRIRGTLQITPHPIFLYSQSNPPAWLVEEQNKAGFVRKT
jgi:hypothetical protein